jgi:hypothetical protein
MEAAPKYDPARVSHEIAAGKRFSFRLFDTEPET